MTTRQDCIARDAADPLRGTRELFALPQGVIYLDGNSLGPLPRATSARITQVVEREWGEGLIRSWNDADWFAMPARLGDRIAPWIGAGPGEVVATDTTSVNLFKVLAAALRIAAQERPQRRVVLSERSNFPTDLYIAQALCEERDRTLQLEDFDRVEDAIDERVAVVMLTHVNYRTGAMLDMRAVTKKAHDAGALVVWDLAHSAGAVPVDLHGADADFAIGCGYKYLNGGPGAPAFVWVHPRHADRFRQPLAGWWGHETPFEFDPQYRPARGISRYLCGTQSVLGMAALGCGLDTLDAALPAGGMRALREKSLALADLFIALVKERLADCDLDVVTPEDHARRGSQVSLASESGAYEIVQALIARGVIGDFRAPDILRFGFTPLYLQYIDVWDAVEHLRQVLASGEWKQPGHARRNAVT